MTLPSSYTIHLPPTFATSFWPSGACPVLPTTAAPDAPAPDPNGPPGSVATYRLPLVRLFSFLQASADLNMRVVALATQRSKSETAHADALLEPTPNGMELTPIFPEAGLHARYYSSFAKLAHVPGFHSAATAWAHVESEAQTSAAAHHRVAKNLDDTVVEPFGSWTRMHHDRLRRAWLTIDTQLEQLEQLSDQVHRVRTTYENKCRLADEAEDAARFAPSNEPVLTLSEARRQHLRERSEATSSDDVVEPRSDPVTEEKLAKQRQLRAQFGFKDRSSAALSSPPTANVLHSPRSSGLAGLGASLQRAGTLSLHRLEEAARSAQASAAAQSGTPDTSLWGNVRAAVAGGLAGVSTGNEAKHVRLRKEAQVAEDNYVALVEELDRARCKMEQAISTQLQVCDQWENERVRALGTALAQYTSAFQPLAKVYGTRSVQKSAAVPYHAATDFSTLIRAYATGTYTPLPQVFQPFYHHELDSLEGQGSQGYGMNLVKWDRARALALDDHQPSTDSGVLSPAPGTEVGLPNPPRVLRLLLTALDRAYEGQLCWPAVPEPTVAQREKRKVWLYDVPLTKVHEVRFMLIGALKSDSEASALSDGGATERDEKVLEFLAAQDPPVLASLVKTWAAELEESLVPQSMWDTVWSVYRAAAVQEQGLRGEGKIEGQADGAESKEQVEEKPKELSFEAQEQVHSAILDDLRSVLARLPKVHLSCLALLTSHLSNLVSTTTSLESDPLYTAKLGRSLGMAVLRPAPTTINTTRAHAYLLAKDLVEFYTLVFPPVLEQSAHTKTVSNVRPSAVRKRTRPVDMRPSRTSMAAAQAKPSGLGLTLNPVPPVPEMGASPPSVSIRGMAEQAKPSGTGSETTEQPRATGEGEPATGQQEQDDDMADTIMAQAQLLLSDDNAASTPTASSFPPEHSHKDEAQPQQGVQLSDAPTGVQLTDAPTVQPSNGLAGVQLSDPPTTTTAPLKRSSAIGSGRRSGRRLHGKRNPESVHEPPSVQKDPTHDSQTSTSSFEHVEHA